MVANVVLFIFRQDRSHNYVSGRILPIDWALTYDLTNVLDGFLIRLLVMSCRS